jgi:hypothetical protein
VAFAVIKVVSFVLVDAYERRSTCRKWKDVPFSVADFDDAEHLQAAFPWHLQQVQSAGEEDN